MKTRIETKRTGIITTKAAACESCLIEKLIEMEKKEKRLSSYFALETVRSFIQLLL